MLHTDYRETQAEEAMEVRTRPHGRQICSENAAVYGARKDKAPRVRKYTIEGLRLEELHALINKLSEIRGYSIYIREE